MVSIKKNTDFVNRIQKRYMAKLKSAQFSVSLIYLKKKPAFHKHVMHQHMQQSIENAILTKMLQYEKRYAEKVTIYDRSKMLKTIEHIVGTPSEKKQLIHLFGKMGVVTKNQKIWQETRTMMQAYEEEMQILKKKIQIQEEVMKRLKNSGKEELPVRKIVKEVMEAIQEEIRLERLRQGW